MRKKILLYSNKTNCLLIILLILFLTSNCILEIPLKRVKLKRIVKEQTLQEKDNIKSGEFNPISLISETNVIKFIYFSVGKIRIGSNSQEFNLVLDNTSDKLFIVKDEEYGDDGVPHRFNPEKSTTFFDLKTKFTYYTENLGYCEEGTCAQDTFNFINNKIFLMKFGLCTSPDFEFDDIDGVLGLGKEPDEKDYSIIHQLKDNGLIDSLSFSIKYDSKDIDGYNKLYLGKHEDFLREDTINVPLSSGYRKKFFSIQINGFGLKKSEHKIEYKKNFNVILDITTNQIRLPMVFYYKIEDNLKEIGCSPLPIHKYVEVSCEKISDSYPNLIFYISDKMLIIPGEYIFPDQSITFVEEDIYRLGTPFFYAFHTLFDEGNKVIQLIPMNSDFIEDEGISTIVLIAIIVGSILIISIAVIVIVIIYRKKKKKREPGTVTEFKMDVGIGQ